MNETCLEVELDSLPRLPRAAPAARTHRAVADVRECAQCGTPFTPRREHARFCSPRCRMAWNREHAGVAAAPAVAIDWSVIAMTEAAGRLAVAGRVGPAPGGGGGGGDGLVGHAGRRDPGPLPPARLREALAGKDVRRRKTEETLEGLRYVRNQLGKSVEPAEFVRPAIGDDGAGGWAWRPLPEPGLGGARAAGTAVGAEQVPRLPGAACRARDRPDLRPLHGVPRPGCGLRRPQLIAAVQYSPLITKKEPRITPASLDFWRANLKPAAASSSGTSMPSESLNPTARLPASAMVYITLMARPDS